MAAARNSIAEADRDAPAKPSSDGIAALPSKPRMVRWCLAHSDPEFIGHVLRRGRPDLGRNRKTLVHRQHTTNRSRGRNDVEDSGPSNDRRPSVLDAAPRNAACLGRWWWRHRPAARIQSGVLRAEHSQSLRRNRRAAWPELDGRNSTSTADLASVIPTSRFPATARCPSPSGASWPWELVRPLQACSETGTSTSRISTPSRSPRALIGTAATASARSTKVGAVSSRFLRSTDTSQATGSWISVRRAGGTDITCMSPAPVVRRS